MGVCMQGFPSGVAVYPLLRPVCWTEEPVCWTEESRPPVRYHYLSDAIALCPAHGLIIDDGFGRPYRGCSPSWTDDNDWRCVLLKIENAESLAAKGHLRRCKPFCTFEELLEQKNLGELV